MKFGMIMVPAVPEGDPEPFDHLIEQIELADQLGFHSAWTTEHHFTSYGRPGLEVLASHALARTEQIRVGAAIVILPFQHPLRVAEDWAVMDHLSKGRVDLGVGRGYQPVEFEGLGIPMDEARERFREGLEIVRGAWTTENFSYDGQFWQIPELTLLPRPYQEPHVPIWQAAVSESTIAEVVRLGLNGLIGPYLRPLDVLKNDYMDVWHAQTQAAGRTDLQMAHNQLVYVGESDEQVREDIEDAVMWYVRKMSKVAAVKDPSKAAAQFKGYSDLAEWFGTLNWDDVYENLLPLCGTPDRVAEGIEWFRDEARCDHILNFMWFGGLSHEKAMRSIRLFGEEVMPRFPASTPTTGQPAVAGASQPA